MRVWQFFMVQFFNKKFFPCFQFFLHKIWKITFTIKSCQNARINFLLKITMWFEHLFYVNTRKTKLYEFPQWEFSKNYTFLKFRFSKWSLPPATIIGIDGIQWFIFFITINANFTHHLITNTNVSNCIKEQLRVRGRNCFNNFSFR